MIEPYWKTRLHIYDLRRRNIEIKGINLALICHLGLEKLRFTHAATPQKFGLKWITNFWPYNFKLLGCSCLHSCQKLSTTMSIADVFLCIDICHPTDGRIGMAGQNHVPQRGPDRGGAPVWGLGEEVPQKLKNFKSSYKQILRIRLFKLRFPTPN